MARPACRSLDGFESDEVLVGFADPRVHRLDAVTVFLHHAAEVDEVSGVLQLPHVSVTGLLTDSNDLLGGRLNCHRAGILDWPCPQTAIAEVASKQWSVSSTDAAYFRINE